jgi:CubicO group peptidase (beta-lactamase class C family)
MGRFMRALINGGTLDGVRILPEARLNEMMAPRQATPAGYLGLVFFGTKVAGHDSIGHGGDTTTFFSDLKIFPEQGIGVFVSRSGTGSKRSVASAPQGWQRQLCCEFGSLSAPIPGQKLGPAEYGAGLKLAIEHGWLLIHESGTYVKLTESGAALFA